MLVLRGCIWVSFGVLVLLIQWVFGESDTMGSYYTDEGARRLVHFDKFSGDCKLFGDKRIVEEILRELAASEAPVSVLEAQELTAIISQCSNKNFNTIGGSAAKEFPHVIYPGTKWCGSGNAAENIEDLGFLRDVDVCCRNHDLCTNVIEPGETKYNLTNDTPFAITHCECSETFRSCLKKVNSTSSHDVGDAYFSSGLFQCVGLQKPITGCMNWSGMLTNACQDYSFDEKGEPIYQIMDMKMF